MRRSIRCGLTALAFGLLLIAQTGCQQKATTPAGGKPVTSMERPETDTRPASAPSAAPASAVNAAQPESRRRFDGMRNPEPTDAAGKPIKMKRGRPE